VKKRDPSRTGRFRPPTRDQLLANRFIRPIAHRLTHSDLWRVKRETVARGMALGIFAGLILPVGQVFLAAALAPAVRANLVVAAAATLITNPFTFPLIYWAAYQVGDTVLGNLTQQQATALAASLPIIVGLLIFAVLGAIAGYVAVRLGWRIWIARRWRRRTGA